MDTIAPWAGSITAIPRRSFYPGLSRTRAPLPPYRIPQDPRARWHARGVSVFRTINTHLTTEGAHVALWMRPRMTRARSRWRALPRKTSTGVAGRGPRRYRPRLCSRRGTGDDRKRGGKISKKKKGSERKTNGRTFREEQKGREKERQGDSVADRGRERAHAVAGRESAICARSLGSSLTGVVCAAHERAQPVRAACCYTAWGPRDTVPCRR